MSGVPLTGLRAENPMAFLAALGALSLASDGVDGTVLMSWQNRDGSWVPVLECAEIETPERVVEVLLTGTSARNLDQELGWGKDLMRVSRTDLRDMLIRRLSDKKNGKESRAAQMLAACLCELPPRRDQDLAPYTPFRLIPRVGRARFLDTARGECEAGIEHLHTCLFEQWQYQRGTQSLRWDPGAAVPMRALMAQAPTHLGPSGVPGALLLAVRGLAFFPLVTTQGHRAAAVGMAQRDRFVWPIWSQPLSERATRILLSMPWSHGLCELREMERDVDVMADDRKARMVAERRARAYRQLRAHDVVACYVARRVQRGDDNEAFGWGEPVVVPDHAGM